MAATYKLTYFDIRGRAEFIRFILAQAGVKYEDIRVGYGDWAKVKPTTPFGVLPTLEIIENGKVLGGAGPIARFLAEKYNLAGSSEIEKAELDGIMDFLNDFMTPVNDFTMERDCTKKEEYKRKLKEEHTPRVFGKLEKLIAVNDSPNGWILGSKVSYVDFRIYTTAAMIKDLLGVDIFEGYPAIKHLSKSVEELPNIATWIKERPDNPY